MIAGTIKENGFAYIPIKLKGPIKEEYIEIEAMIDTGFTGFLSVSLAEGVKAGLVLATFVNVKLANEQKIVEVACLGEVCIEDKYKDIDTVLLGSGESTVGQRFLKEFDLTMVLDVVNSKVFLLQRNELPQKTETSTPPTLPPQK